MTEVQAILATGAGYIVATGVGFLISRIAINRRETKVNRSQAKKEGIKEGTEYQLLKQLDERVENLPCQADPKYMVQQGQMYQKIDDIQLRVTRIEKAINDKAR